MSHYLIQRIAAAPNIALHRHTKVLGLIRASHLESLRFETGDAASQDLKVRHLFLFLGPRLAAAGEGAAAKQSLHQILALAIEAA